MAPQAWASQQVDAAFAASPQPAALPPELARITAPLDALARFEDLLLASASHPAMLLYLDQTQSRRHGLNENYARELLELHTLGVGGGYTQNDVHELTRILTSWSVNWPAGEGFRFVERRHDQGSKLFMGRTYPNEGMKEGEDALRFLTRQPATARRPRHGPGLAHPRAGLPQRIPQPGDAGPCGPRAAARAHRPDAGQPRLHAQINHESPCPCTPPRPPAVCLPHRRLLVLGSLSALALGSCSRRVWAQPAPAGVTTALDGGRLAVVFLRGAYDGLSALVPYADRDYYAIRPNIAIAPPDGTAQTALRLDSTFALHPALSPLMPLWQQGVFGFVPAAGLVVPNRSHFDAQYQMETAWPGSTRHASGWLNRLTDPGAGAAANAVALGVGEANPAILGGPAQVRLMPSGLAYGPTTRRARLCWTCTPATTRSAQRSGRGRAAACRARRR